MEVKKKIENEIKEFKNSPEYKAALKESKATAKFENEVPQILADALENEAVFVVAGDRAPVIEYVLSELTYKYGVKNIQMIEDHTFNEGDILVEFNKEGMTIESLSLKYDKMRVDEQLKFAFDTFMYAASKKAGRVIHGRFIYRKPKNEDEKEQIIQDLMFALDKCHGCISDNLYDAEWQPEVAAAMAILELPKTKAIKKLEEVKGNFKTLLGE